MPLLSSNTAIFIPARMASTRLPGKPLADIGGKPMIVHVWEKAHAAGIGPVYVACAEQEIAAAVEKAGGKAVLTKPDHPSGTDRIYEALLQVEKESGQKIEIIVNVQGDLPLLDPHYITLAAEMLSSAGADIGTLAAPITRAEELTSPHVVKPVLAINAERTGGRALYFTRSTAPYGEGPLYHHIGLYAYTRLALERFVSLPPSPLEQREKLEQLRALENTMHIEVGIVGGVPLGVDTPEDLAYVRAALKG